MSVVMMSRSLAPALLRGDGVGAWPTSNTEEGDKIRPPVSNSSNSMAYFAVTQLSITILQRTKTSLDESKYVFSNLLFLWWWAFFSLRPLTLSLIL